MYNNPIVDKIISGDLVGLNNLSKIENGVAYIERLQFVNNLDVKTKPIGKFTADIPEEYLKCRNKKLSNINFRICNFKHTSWLKSEFDNVTFDNCDLSLLRFDACTFNNCEFVKCNFKNSVVNGFVYKETGSVSNTRFIECDFRGTLHGASKYTNCSFYNCDFDSVDFNGSRFEYCKFEGLLDSVFFRKMPKYLPTGYFFFNPKPKNYINNMVNIDFSSSVLSGVSFLDGIDLSKCIFPKKENYIYLKNPMDVFSRAQKIVAETWLGQDKKILEAFLNFEIAEAVNKRIDIINTEDPIKHWGKDLTDKYKDLIKQAILEVESNK